VRGLYDHDAGWLRELAAEQARRARQAAENAWKDRRR
jgi:hypothetical protein